MGVSQASQGVLDTTELIISFGDAGYGGNHDPRGKTRNLSSPSVLTASVSPM